MAEIDKLIATTARLRDPDGCPWDREQTHRSICDCMIEEVAELIQAIDQDDVANLREELGDILFHIVLHSQMASEAGKFTFDDVVREVNEKMIRRHPHVFGKGIKLFTSEAVVKQWDQIKLTEKGNIKSSLFKELPPSLNSILTAREIWKQIRKIKSNIDDVVNNTNISALSSTINEETAGQKLFEIVAACRDAGIDPESALRRFTAKVIIEVKLKHPTHCE